jgi:hypothetical protein
MRTISDHSLERLRNPTWKPRRKFQGTKMSTLPKNPTRRRNPRRTPFPMTKGIKRYQNPPPWTGKKQTRFTEEGGTITALTPHAWEYIKLKLEELEQTGTRLIALADQLKKSSEDIRKLGHDLEAIGPYIQEIADRE